MLFYAILLDSGETGEINISADSIWLTGMEWSDVWLKLLREMTQLSLRGEHGSCCAIKCSDWFYVIYYNRFYTEVVSKKGRASSAIKY